MHTHLLFHSAAHEMCLRGCAVLMVPTETSTKETRSSSSICSARQRLSSACHQRNPKGLHVRCGASLPELYPQARHCLPRPVRAIFEWKRLQSRGKRINEVRLDVHCAATAILASMSAPFSSASYSLDRSTTASALRFLSARARAQTPLALLSTPQVSADGLSPSRTLISRVGGVEEGQCSKSQDGPSGWGRSPASNAGH